MSCIHCGESKPGVIFYKNICRPCKLAYARTHKGLAITLHKSMVQRSKRRGQAVPSFTRRELQTWLKEQPNYYKYYRAWEASKYESELKPSIDRIDKKKNYTYLNMQLLTWKDNNTKGYTEKHKPVLQYSLDNKFIQRFESVDEALKALGKQTGHISAVARGERKTAFGYKWEYLV